MKVIFCLFLLINGTAYSQSFTKITGSPLTDEGGNSRSVNWIDYDKDGDLDLYVTNGPSQGMNNYFYENQGGVFTKRTGIGITEDGKSSDGSSWGDYDNDGNIDLFVANWYNQNNLLYKNNGDKTFTLITGTPVYTDRGYSETGAWNDFNRDGNLDLFVCNSETPFLNFLYMNDGQGNFMRITEGSIATETATSRNADWADYDNDGDADLFVATEANQNDRLYRNDWPNGFTKITDGPLVNNSGSSFGSSWGDYDNDGDFDLFVSNHENQNNFLYKNNGDGTFTQINEGPVVSDGGYSIGSSWGDIDNDGDIDLFVANGFAAGKVTDFLYLNNGDGTFSKSSINVTADSGWSYGCSLGDYNNDGWLDLAVAKCYAGQKNVLFKNDGGSNHWIKFNLNGTVSNKSAIGTVVKLYAHIGNTVVMQMQQVTGQNGYCGQNLQLHFGLGDASIIDSAVIRWPSGIHQKLLSIPADQVLDIEEDGSLLETGESGMVFPSETILYQNYPNPFNPATRIDFFLSRGGEVSLKVFNSLGEEVDSVINGYLNKGYHSVVFNAERLPSGIYLYTLTSEDIQLVRKLLLIK